MQHVKKHQLRLAIQRPTMVDASSTKVRSELKYIGEVSEYSEGYRLRAASLPMVFHLNTAPVMIAAMLRHIKQHVQQAERARAWTL